MFFFFSSAAQRSFLHTLLHTHTGEMMIIRNTLLRQKFLGIFRAYKVLLSLAFLLLCGIITVPVTYSTFYSTSSAEYYVIDTVQDWKIRSGVQSKWRNDDYQKYNTQTEVPWDFRAYKVLLSLAFLLLCGIITVPVTYSTFYSTSSAEYYVIDTIQDWQIR